jgi:hypothetical protein
MFGHETGVVPFIADAIIVLRMLAHIGSFAHAKVCFWAICALTMAVCSWPTLCKNSILVRFREYQG